MKAPFYRSAALVGMALVCGAGFTASPLPSSQPLSLVIDVVPTSPALPTAPKSEQLMFQFMIVPTMRQVSEKDWYLSDSELPSTPNDFHPQPRLVCTVPPLKYEEESVHKPPWLGLLVF